MKEGNPPRADSDWSRERLSSLVEAIRRISEDLEFDVVLPQIADSARSLTGASFGLITAVDDSGDVQDLVISGLSPGEQQAMRSAYDRGTETFRYLSSLPEPLRVRDFGAHATSVGIAGFMPSVGPFMATRIRVRDKQLGNIFIGKEPPGEEFTSEDEETLKMFANQAAVAITNAHRYGEERGAKAGLEALINTSPIGMLVLDPQASNSVTANREACRILGLPPDRPVEHLPLLAQLAFRRMDGFRDPHRRSSGQACGPHRRVCARRGAGRRPPERRGGDHPRQRHAHPRRRR